MESHVTTKEEAVALLKRAVDERTSWETRIKCLSELSLALEIEERRFEEVTGDIAGAANLRLAQPIGSLMLAIRDSEELCDDIYESWVHDSQAGLPQTVAAMRFILAYQSGTTGQAQGPLAEEEFLTRLHEWVASEPSSTGCTPNDCSADPGSLAKLLQARRVYATGLLAIGLVANEACNEAVRNGMAVELSKDLRHAAFGAPSRSGPSMPEYPCSAAAAIEPEAAEAQTPDHPATSESTTLPTSRLVPTPEICSFVLHGVDLEELSARRARHVVQCFRWLAEYLEVLGPVLQSDGVAVVLHLLRQWQDRPTWLPDLLGYTAALLAHRRFAELLVDAGGVQQLLLMPRTKHTFHGLSFAFFSLSAIPTAFERVCALPNEDVSNMVEFMLSVLSCGYDPARKNAVLFFGGAIHFRAVLSIFDCSNGLARVLDCLQTVLMLLHGQQDLKTEKQVAFHATAALRQYFRAHLVLHVANIRQRQLCHSPSKQASTASLRVIDVSAEAVDAAVAAIETDRRVGEAFLREPWPPLADFLQRGGTSTLLDFIQLTPGERYCNEIARHALEILQLASLAPTCRQRLLEIFPEPSAAAHTNGIPVLLDVAHGIVYSNDPEVMQPALTTLANCVTVPPSMTHLVCPAEKPSSRKRQGRAAGQTPGQLPTPGQPHTPGQAPDTSGKFAAELLQAGSMEVEGAVAEARAGYALARARVRRASGMRVLLALLHARASMTAQASHALRTLAVKCLVGLAHDPAMRHILSKLQVWRLLAQLVHEPDKRMPGSGLALRRAGETASSSNSFNLLATQLMNLTSPGLGKAGAAAESDAIAPALHKIERAAIAASTQITYPPAELLMLVEDHLRASGLHASADMLTQEAGLPRLLADSQARLPADAAPEARDLREQQSTPLFVFSSQREPPSSATQPSRGDAKASQKWRPLPIAPALMSVITKASGNVNGLSGVKQASAEQSDPAHSCLPPAEANAGSAACEGTPNPVEHGLKRRRHSEETPRPTVKHRAAEALQWTPSAFKTPAKQEAPVHDTAQGIGSDVRGRRNPALANLPCRRSVVPESEACKTPMPIRSSLKESIASPPQTQQQLAAAHAGPGDRIVHSRLHAIVMQHLRHQHKAACLKAAAPISTLPPMSLLRPKSLPQAQRSLEASSQVQRRLMQRSTVAPHGGWGGRRQDRRFVYSRYRQVRCVRDEDSATYRSCAFAGNFAAMALGTHSGEVRLHDTLSGDLIDTIDAHESPVYQLQVYEGRGRSMLLSSCRGEAKLWDVGACRDRAEALWAPNEAAGDPLRTFEGVRTAIFRPDGLLVAGVEAAGREHDPILFDLASESQTRIDIRQAGWRTRHPESLCFSASGELLLYGPMLWDPRSPRCVHTFDVLTYNPCASTFHPAGLEAIVNAEVWDLRTLRLQRCVPCLDSAVLTWNASGDCGYATLRRASDDLGAALMPKRAKHPLHAAFRTVDATDFSEIATTCMEGRCVLDLCVDAADSFIGIVSVEPNELMSSSARVYEVGRRRVQDDESDVEDGDGSDGDDDDDEDAESGDDEGAQLIPAWGPMTAAEEPSADLAADPRGHSPADRAAPSSSGSEVSSDGGGDDETADLEEDALLEEDMDEDLDQYRMRMALAREDNDADEDLLMDPETDGMSDDSLSE